MAKPIKFSLMGVNIEVLTWRKLFAALCVLGIGVGFYLACKLYPLEKVFYGMACILGASGWLCVFTAASSTTPDEERMLNIILFMLLAFNIMLSTGAMIQAIKYQKKCRQTIAQVLSVEPKLNTMKIKTTKGHVYYLSLHENSSAKNCFLHQCKQAIKRHRKIYIRFTLTPDMVSGKDPKIDVNKIRFVGPPKKDISSPASDESGTPAKIK